NRKQMVNDVPNLVVGGVTVGVGGYVVGGPGGLNLAPGGTSSATADFTVSTLSGDGTFSFGTLVIQQGGAFKGTLSGNSLSISGGTLTYTGDGSHVSTTTVSAGVLELDGGHLNDVTVSGGKFSMRNNAEVRVLNADGGQVGTPAGRVGTAHQGKLTSEITWLTPIAGPTHFQVVRMDKCTSWKGHFVVTLLNEYAPDPRTSF